MVTILRFELAQRLRRISTYVYFLVLFALGFIFVLGSGGGVNSLTIDFGTGGKVLVNSPYALNLILTYVSFLGIIITAALAGQATYQDIDHNCTAFLYTAPITKFDYLVGRFLGTLAVQLVVFSGVGLGAWTSMLMPWLDPTRVGPERFMAYLQPYLIFIWPNLLITTAIFFAVAAFTRKMLPVYVSSVIFLIGYLVALQLSGDISANVPASLADPFGGNAFGLLTRYWTSYECNTRLAPFTGILLLNRVLWVGLGVAVFAFTYARFSMSHASGLGRRPRPSLESAGEPEAAAPEAPPVTSPVFTLHASFRQFLSLTELQFMETVKNVFFAVIVLAGFLFALVAAFNLGDPFSAKVYPVTYRMIELAGGAFGLFVFAINTFYAGELVWRERDARVSQIVDAIPVQRWVLFSSKLSALMLIQIPLILVILAAGLMVQVTHGYYHFEFGLYFRELFLNRLPMYWILCVLALWIHALVNQKYLGHFMMVLACVASVVALPRMGLEHYLYRFAQLPPFIYSDMNGYGSFLPRLIWFHLYWGLAAVMLALVTNLLWVRGTEGSWRERFKLARARFSPGSRLGLAICALLMMATGGYIFYNTNVLNLYQTTRQFEEERAQYEKKYRKYKALPLPRLTDVKAQVDLDPDRRSVNIRGTLSLENKTAADIDRVAVTIWPGNLQPIPIPKGMAVEKLEFGDGQIPEIQDRSLGFYLYRLARPLPPQGRTTLEFSLHYALAGFPNANDDTDIVHNGSFVDASYAPVLGYNANVELGDDSLRHRHGLLTLKRDPKLEDVAARQHNGEPDADWVNLDTTVSTSPSQVAITPGYLQKEWTQDGRRYFQYKTDAPVVALFALNSGRYQVMRDRWKDVNLEIYYQRGHEFDLERMRDSMKATLEYCSANFSPFQFHQLRIVEFPRYQSFAESLPNTIPFSEAIGFITRVDPGKKDDLDLPFYVTAHEVGHQWWGHQVYGAFAEGQVLIVESMAQYTALMVMKHRLGPEAMKSFLRHELDRYLFGRSQERNEEKPILRVESSQAYIRYSKGSLVMYALQDYIGEDKVNQALAAFLKTYAFQGPPYPTSRELVDAFRKVTPPEYQYLYTDLFENITLYENRAVSATYTRQPDGKYQVRLSVESKKYRADGKGREEEIPINDWIDIGVLDRDGHYLYLQKQKVESAKSAFTLVVDKLPAQAGIDPLNKLIDRVPDDNVVSVKKQ